jgi:hypothetical protein
MNMIRLARAVAVVTLLAAMAAPAVKAAPIATLDGRPIAIGLAADLDCHDFEYPVIRCFDSEASLQSDVATQIARRDAKASYAVDTIGYVVVYEHASYGGATKVLSSDVPWLSDIGWNDRISSFKSFGASGSFNEHSPSGGFIWWYGPTSRVASLSGTYNDKFSSFYVN